MWLYDLFENEPLDKLIVHFRTQYFSQFIYLSFLRVKINLWNLSSKLWKIYIKPLGKWLTYYTLINLRKTMIWIKQMYHLMDFWDVFKKYSKQQQNCNNYEFRQGYYTQYWSELLRNKGKRKLQSNSLCHKPNRNWKRNIKVFKLKITKVRKTEHYPHHHHSPRSLLTEHHTNNTTGGSRLLPQFHYNINANHNNFHSTKSP